jgi:hypothetical protein
MVNITDNINLIIILIVYVLRYILPEFSNCVYAYMEMFIPCDNRHMQCYLEINLIIFLRSICINCQIITKSRDLQGTREAVALLLKSSPDSNALSRILLNNIINTREMARTKALCSVFVCIVITRSKYIYLRNPPPICIALNIRGRRL